MIGVLLKEQDDVLHRDDDGLLQQHTVGQRNVLEEGLQVVEQIDEVHLELDHLVPVQLHLAQSFDRLAQFHYLPDDALIEDATGTGTRHSQGEQVALGSEKGQLPVLLLVEVEQGQVHHCVDKGQVVLLGYLLAEKVPALALGRTGQEVLVDLRVDLLQQVRAAVARGDRLDDAQLQEPLDTWTGADTKTILKWDAIWRV